MIRMPPADFRRAELHPLPGPDGLDAGRPRGGNWRSAAVAQGQQRQQRLLQLIEDGRRREAAAKRQRAQQEQALAAQRHHRKVQAVKARLLLLEKLQQRLMVQEQDSVDQGQSNAEAYLQQQQSEPAESLPQSHYTHNTQLHEGLAAVTAATQHFSPFNSAAELPLRHPLNLPLTRVSLGSLAKDMAVAEGGGQQKDGASSHSYTTSKSKLAPPPGTEASHRAGDAGSHLSPAFSHRTGPHRQPMTEDEIMLERLLQELALEEQASNFCLDEEGRMMHGPDAAILTASMLLNVTRADDPLEVCTARVSGRGLVGVHAASLAPFANLVHLEAGDNALPLKDLASLPNLRALELPLNFLRQVEVPAGAFTHLRLLDLSHNDLEPEAIAALSQLPALKSLDLSNNHLSGLPSLGLAAEDDDDEGDTEKQEAEHGEADAQEQGGLEDPAEAKAEAGQNPATGAPSRRSRPVAFPTLETLILDHNALDGLMLGVALAGLPRLKFLSANHNRVGFIPHLTSSAMSISGEQAGGPPPFPALKELSLAHNQLRKAEDVLELGRWPSLTTLYLQGTD